MRTTALLFPMVLVVGYAGSGMAQDLEPRAYSASPIGSRFIVVGATRSSGEVLLDPSAPVEDVHATTTALTVGAGATFSFFGRTGLAVAAFPYAWASATGRIGETTPTVSRSGLADPRLKFSVNLIGGRALSLSEFGRERRPTIVGTSITVVPPIGQYYPSKLVNLGANRWAFRPEVGISHAINKWTIDGYAGVWLFTANNEYYTGSFVRTQDPIVAVQGHASYTLKPRLWVAFDATFYSGGTSVINGAETESVQRNSRVGATVSLPLTQQQSIKAAVTKGATTRIGANFTTVTAAWQISWFD